MNEIDIFLKDFYGKYAGETLSDEKLNTIKNTYGDDYSTLISDLYGKYTGGSVDDDKMNLIVTTYNLKKKDTTQSDLEKSTLDSSKSTEPTVSDSKEDPFLESLLEKDEEVAKVDLSKKLLGKGFSVTETGIGDALKIIDNITGEEVDIDLQPVFGIGKGKDIEKLRKLIDSSTDSKRELLSKNQYDDFVNDTEGYFQSLNKFYPGFNFETDGMTATISKDGDVISYVDIRNKSTKDFSELNKVLYDNIKDEDVSKLLDDESKEYDLIQEKIKDIESKVDISMEKSEEDIYDQNYLSKTLEYLEKKGKAIDPELKEKAKDARANKELFKKVLSDQFQNDPEALSMIEDFNNFLTLEKRDESISRAKKLAIENYFETRPDRGALMEIVNKKHKQADDEEKRILANVEQAKKDLKKMYTSIGNDLKDLSEKNPGVKIDFVTDENGVPIDLVSSKKIDGLDQVKQKIIGGIKTFSDFADKSEKDFNTLISNKENIEKIKDASKRNYGALDMFAADVKSGYVNLIGSLVTLAEISQPGTAGVVVGLEGKEMIDKNRETMEGYFKSKRAYDEAIKEGSKFEFSYRTFGEQFANISLAIASAGAGTSIGLSNAATQAVIATTFGASAAGSKYNEMQNRIEAASKAKQALKDLEKTKGKIPVEKYLNEKYELERATKDLDLSQGQIVGSVIASGVVEGTITRYLGTIPNAFNVLKGVRTGTKDFIRNYYRTNLKAIKDAGISIAKATGQEVIEETSIDFLTQVSDYLFLGDAVDISTLDDTAVMAIVTSGGMNVPSTAYGTIMTQVGASRYRSKVGKFADDINKLKDLLKDESLGGVARTLIHNKITENIKKIAEITNEMEADALAVGADGIKDLVMLKNMKDSLLKEAGVKADDTQEVVKAKIDNHLKKQKDNDFRDKLEYVSKKKNEILSDIDYDSAIDKIFGEKGREIADGLDSKLTAKEKFVEVHKNFKKGIQEQIKEEITKEEQIKEEITKEEVVKEPVSTQVSPQTKVETIGELLDRPISLTELGGSKLDTPIEGVMYLDGQQVVVEDENGNITEIGNVDEISGKTLEEMGIKQQMPTVNVQKDENLEIEGKVYNIESGRIKRDNKGNIVSVTIDQVDKPRSKTLRGRDAEDAAYQILLRKAESPEQTQRINEILEQDEEFKNELRKAEDTAKEDAAKDTEQDTREEIVKIDYFGEELEIKKSTLESTLEESKTKEGFANFNVIIPREKGDVKLGFMSLKKTADNTYEVSLSSLDMSLNLGNKAEGKGLGTMMYEKLIEYANKNGITINNSDNMNEKSSSVWKKLEKKGLVSFVDGKYTNKIVEDTREESIASPEVTIEDAPDGTFLNIEIVAGKDGREITQKEILDALPVEPLNVEVSGKTLVIQVPRKLSGSEMMKLAKDTEQDAIPQMSGKKGVLHAQSKEKMDLYGGKFVTNLFVKPKNIIKDERPKPGNRLFNEPLKAVKAIADKYYKRVFKGERPKFKGVKKIDKEFAKRISDAFEAMQDNPNDPEVKAAYEAMAKETMDQYQDFKDAGYTIEINNSEPYKNAQEMIDDLRNNKRMKIFSTESGFGDTPITDKQREENPLLRDSGVKDVNGETLLVNDIFRAVHDFYGHAELGNGFGPVGEENAWNVHARMFSPLARRAMTTETRGQNSYVNFSGINDEAFKLRDEARKLRKEGKEAEAEALVAKVYEIMKFADQKVGLLPEEFSSIEQDEASKVEDEVSKLKKAIKGDLDTQVENARKAIAEALPDVEIVIHDTREDFKKATGDIDRGSFDGKTIHINRQDAIKTTVAHEVFHALFLKNLKSDKQAMDLAERFVKALYPALSAETRKKLDNFAKMYKGKYAWLKNEERLAEFFGMLASEYDVMPKPKQNLVKRFLDRIAKMFGLKPIKQNEVLDLLKTLAGKVAKGEVITEGDLTSLDEETSVKEEDAKNVRKQKINVGLVRSKSKGGSKVGRGISVKTVNKEKVISENNELNSKFLKENNPEGFIKNAKTIAQYPIVKSKYKGKVETISDAEVVHNIFVNEIADNLLYLIDKFNPEYRDIATLWYDGANQMANEIAQEYNVKTEVVAGVIASLSPQKDWYQNVRMAELVFDAFKKDPVFNEEMYKIQESINEIGLKAAKKKGGKAYKDKLGKVNDTMKILKKYVGKKLSETPSFVKAHIVRLNNEFENNKEYMVVRPDGKEVGLARKKDGAPKRVAWGSYTEIGKAVSIIEDGSQENISKVLGEAHKIRNFYNNIIDPMSPNGDVTIDTHAVAAALLLPLSGNTVEVGQNFGTKPGISNSGALGMKGLYYIYSDGYSLAAERSGYLPRQVQSITWEAVRGLFTDKFKGQRKNVSDVRKLWEDYNNGKITKDELRQKIEERAGGITDPSWSRFVSDEPGKRTREETDGSGISTTSGNTIRKQLNPAANEIIRKGKELKVSDTAIREVLISEGYSVEDADSFVSEYNEISRKEGLKREGVRVISNKTLKTLDAIKKFTTSARAYKPKSMQIGQESRDGFIEANVKKAEFYLRKLNKIAKDEEVLENLELYMRGDKSVDLPDNVAEIAFLMREHIDALSKQLISLGAVEADESVENIMNNIGSYMTRSYEVFTNKDWKNQVSDQVIQEAKNFLRKEYMEQAEFIAMKENRPVDKVLEEYVDSTVSKLLKKEEAMSYVKMANESKKSLGILKRRGDIPAPLRALMGEYKSPAQNYIISVQKVATLAAQQRFLNEMVEAGKGVWLFEKNKAPEGFRVEIATEGSKTMSPLNGLYTSKEIAEELKGSGLVDPEGIFSKAKPLYDFYQKAVGLVKFNKTILSPGTHAKNFIGNLFFMAANGYIDPKDYYTSTRVVLNDLAEGTNEVLNEKMLEYIDAGIINQSATLRDLKDMMAGKENRVDSQEDFEKRMIERFNKPNNKFVKGVKRASEIAQNMYQAEDDFFKIVAYEANKQRYAKAYHKKPFEQLNDTQKKEVLDKVKEIVKNTLPNYNRIAEVRRLIRAVPFTGTFISFHMEAIRTAANTLSLTYEELKDPRTRTIGMQRLTGIGVLFALKFTLIPMITNALVGDDDELEKSARRVLPPWSKDSNIIIESVDNGVLRYRDLSASDPWGVVDKVINAARYREDTLDGFVGVIEETLSPFVTEDILFAAIKDATSKTSKSNTTSENIDVVVNAIYKAFSPGALTSAERIFIEDKKSLMDLVAGKTLSYKKDDKTNEIVGQLTGFKSREIKLKDAAFFKFRDIASAGYGKSMPGAARNASGSYSKAWYDYTNKKISKAKLDKSYEESNKKYKEVLETTLADYKAFIKLGLSPREIKEQMKKAGFNQTEIKYISRGYIPNLKKKKR